MKLLIMLLSLIVGLTLVNTGCSPNHSAATLDATSDQALQRSLSRLALNVPEKDRNNFVKAMLELAFSEVELKSFDALPHDRKPNIAYIPVGKSSAFQPYQGLNLAQLREAVKQKRSAKPEPGLNTPEPTVPDKEVALLPANSEPKQQTMLQPASPEVPIPTSKESVTPDVSSPPTELETLKKANPFAKKSGDVERPESKPTDTPMPVEPSKPSKQEPAIPKVTTPKSPPRLGTITPKKSEGYTPVILGRNATTIKEYELANDARKKKLEDDNDVMLIHESLIVAYETIADGFVYCRPTEGPFKNQVCVVREVYFTKNK